MTPPKKRNRVQRLDIHLDPQMIDWLRQESARRDVSISELLRRLIKRAMISSS